MRIIVNISEIIGSTHLPFTPSTRTTLLLITILFASLLSSSVSAHGSGRHYFYGPLSETGGGSHDEVYETEVRNLAGGDSPIKLGHCEKTGTSIRLDSHDIIDGTRYVYTTSFEYLPEVADNMDCSTNITVHRYSCFKGSEFSHYGDTHKCTALPEPDPEEPHPMPDRPEEPLPEEASPGEDNPPPLAENPKANPLPCASSGNPIDTATGAKCQRETDYKSNSPSGLSFSRTLSTDSNFWENSRDPATPAPMGKIWRHNYSAKLKFFSKEFNGETFTDVLAIRADGRKLHFVQEYDKWELDADWEIVDGQWEYIVKEWRKIFLWKADADVTETVTRIVEDGNTTGWQLINNDNETEHYDTDGQLRKITKLNGIELVLDHDVPLNMGGDDNPDTPDKVTDSFGERLLLTHVDGLLIAMTDPADEFYRYTYDDINNLSCITYPDETPLDNSDNPNKCYQYENTDFPHYPTGLTDENGNRFADWDYDDLGRAILSVHAGGADRVSLDYEDGKTTVTQASGQVQVNHIESKLGVKKIVQIDGGPCVNCNNQNQKTTFDDNGFVSSSTDFNGNLTSYVNNSRGLEISRTEAVGTSEERTITTEWHPVFRFPVKITESGRITEIFYNEKGQEIRHSVTDTKTGIERSTWRYYNVLNLIETFRGGLYEDRRTNFGYSEKGCLNNITNDSGHAINITSHDAHCNPLTIIDANGTKTTNKWSARGWLLSSTTDGKTTKFEYDNVGNLVNETLPDGTFTLYEYDDAQREIAEVDNFGNRIEYLLDRADNRIRISFKDPNGATTKVTMREYDKLNRLIEIIGGGGHSTVFAYDDNGNQTEITVDPTGLNQKTFQTFDALNRLNIITDANNGITTFTHDARDNITSVTDAEGLTTNYTYDAFDSMIQQLSPDTGLATFQYFYTKNPDTREDAMGIMRFFNYDFLDRVIGKGYAPVSEYSYRSPATDEFTYDTCENGIGRLCEMADESGTTYSAYDARGNDTSETVTMDGIVATIGKEWSNADKLTQINYPSGRDVYNIRDELGQISHVLTRQGTTEGIVASSMKYEPFGPMNSMVYGNNLVQSRTYDQDYRLTNLFTINGSIHQDLGYTYDAANNITDIANAVDNSHSQILGYDPLNRLTDATGNYGDIDYSYDAIGNRLNKTVDTVTDTYDYDINSHHLEQKIIGGVPTDYGYDANGNMTSNGKFNFIFGDNNRLQDAFDKDGNFVMTNTYNGYGQRVKKYDGISNTYFYYDSDLLLSEYNDLDKKFVDYIFIDEELVSVYIEDKPYFVHNDHLGRPVFLTDENQNVVWRAHYLPFGKAVITKEDITFNIRAPGQYEDQETGLYYNMARYYDPEIGRYITSDPIGLAGGINTYSYVNQNPTNYTDPTGQVAPIAYGAIAIGIGVTGVVTGVISASNGGTFAEGFVRGAGSAAVTVVVALAGTTLSGLTITGATMSKTALGIIGGQGFGLGLRAIGIGSIIGDAEGAERPGSECF